MIKPGMEVVCRLPPALNAAGQPAKHPVLGRTYTVETVYEADYGQGCTLKGLDPFPYEGYVLYAGPFNSLHVAGGWYFEALPA